MEDIKKEKNIHMCFMVSIVLAMFMEIYDFFKDDPQALMWDAKIQYIFSLVEEE